VKAVHFGAGNIGRGFIGAILQDAGFHVTFADVNSKLILTSTQRANTRSSSYLGLMAIPAKPDTKNFDAVDSVKSAAELTAQIASADLVTTSVASKCFGARGTCHSEAGVEARKKTEPLLIMACESAINATEALKHHIEVVADGQPLNAEFANTAVDRIVPLQRSGLGLDVEVEPFSEWVIDDSSVTNKSALKALASSGAHLVGNLTPFIERKLFTVNAAHAATAMSGQLSWRQDKF
jgi:mannitol-1-phosphate 5-dehydrogenase